MLVGQSYRLGRIGWYVGWSTVLDGGAGMLISQSTRIDRLVCWSYSQPG